MRPEQPSVRFVSRRVAKLDRAWACQTRAGKLVALPGATTDGASIPTVFWWVPGYSPYEGDTLPAVFAHDQLYAAELVPRDVADKILYDLLIANGVSHGRATVYYDMVRACGWAVWKRHTRESIMKARMFAGMVSAVKTGENQ